MFSHPSNAYNSWSWTRLKPGRHNLIQVVHTDGRNPCTWNTTCFTTRKLKWKWNIWDSNPGIPSWGWGISSRTLAVAPDVHPKISTCTNGHGIRKHLSDGENFCYHLSKKCPRYGPPCHPCQGPSFPTPCRNGLLLYHQLQAQGFFPICALWLQILLSSDLIHNPRVVSTTNRTAVHGDQHNFPPSQVHLLFYGDTYLKFYGLDFNPSH